MNMRKIILPAMIIVSITAFTGYNIYQSQNSTNLSSLALANIEALANRSESTGNSVTCYSSSESKSGATYYDCGPCEKQFNSKGTGSSSTCTTK